MLCGAAVALGVSGWRLVGSEDGSLFQAVTGFASKIDESEPNGGGLFHVE